MKIYTRTGDDGTTGLIGGDRVPKSDPRLECYGTIDELNAALGLAIASADVGAAPLLPQLQTVQNELFVIGSHLATPEGSPHRRNLPVLKESAIARLELQIDEAEKELPPLRNFILPGGSELSSRLHLARTICRRAERLLVGLGGHAPVDPLIVRYLNRLSDWLFVQARWANHVADIADVPWVK
jgi:cob(I)alamin adenosyltransferase